MYRRYQVAECMRAMIKLMIKIKIKRNINLLIQEMKKEEKEKRVARVKRRIKIKKAQVEGVVIEKAVAQRRRPCCR